MTTYSPRLDLPFLEGAQAQKHVTHNEALERLDIAVQAMVRGWEETTPPGNPVEGACWLVGDAASGAWSGHAGDIAAFAGGGWLFVTPREGWRLWDRANARLMVLTGSGWIPTGGTVTLQNLSGIGVNTTSDATNRLAVASDATLLMHAGTDHRLKVNRAGPADTASLLFQSDWSGRAEMGIAGEEDFTVKVSADGAAWTTGLRVSATTGGVALSQLTFAPQAEPDAPAPGCTYFDVGTAKLRCWDGTGWRDLF